MNTCEKHRGEGVLWLTKPLPRVICGASNPSRPRRNATRFLVPGTRRLQSLPVPCATIGLAAFPYESEPGMTARLLDGTKIRDLVFAELREEVQRLVADGIRPGLAAVLVGDNPASQLYVTSKIAACEQLGLTSWMHTPPATVTTDELLRLIHDLNKDDAVDGILIQLPLPAQVDAKCILEAVDPAKDVDGFHPVNLGRLVSGRPGLVACTPAGCMEILGRAGIKIEGANAVVLGRSDIVGKPMALLLMHANATVTICHSKTRDLPDVVRRADIVVAAMGKAGYVEADWIRPGAGVIDVGTNKVTDLKEAARLLRNFPARLEKFHAKGSVLVGDVHPDAVNTAGALTPVPGGVGPMTITMLMSNTVKAARLRRGKTKIHAVPSTARAR
jgi:methylenetetrahydrofolate dehydrogenase (NADP+)/methenyltetrahydrofolate cyclohydrolase